MFGDELFHSLNLRILILGDKTLQLLGVGLFVRIKCDTAGFQRHAWQKARAQRMAATAVIYHLMPSWFKFKEYFLTVILYMY